MTRMKLKVLRTFSMRRGDGSTVTYRRGELITVSGLSKHLQSLISGGYLARETKTTLQEATPNGEKENE